MEKEVGSQQEICLFNGKEVAFLVEKDGLMINTTEMAKIFDGRVENFTRNIGTKRLF
jgi:hypothetical protein